MTYKNALKVKLGDVLHSKDGWSFTVNEITEKSNAANTEKYLCFKGITKRGIFVFYNHKEIR
jgi:hypothetical protein